MPLPPDDPRLRETAGGQPLTPPETAPSEGAPPAPPSEEAPGQEPAIPQAVGDQEQGMTQASPEEQEQANRLVARAWQLIYSDNVLPQIVTTLEGGAGEDADGDPVAGLAQATDIVAARIGQAAEEAGEQLMPDAAHFAFGEILEELAEVSRRAGIKDYSQDKDALETAYFQALDIYRERLQQAGVINQEHAQQDMQKLVAMDQNGQLERILRDLAANDEAGAAGGPEPPPEKEKKPKGFNAAMGV